MKQVRDRVAVVTGAASGIGYALAERFVGDGMAVVLADIDEAALEEAEGQLRGQGARVAAVPTDVSNPTAVEFLAARSLAEFGAVHVLCNNAGVVGRGAVWESTLEDWRWVMDVNLWGVIHGLRAFVPILIEQEEAHVVNTASMAGLINGTLGSYSVTKHAVVALSEALHLDLRARGHDHVGVSVLCPGWVRTRITDSERNRPASAPAADGVHAIEAAARDMIRALVDNGMEPSRVATAVTEAITSGEFYVVTHPRMFPAVESRFDDIRARRAPTPTLG